MPNNYWNHSSPPGIPTLYSLTSSASIRTLWALEELIANGKLEKYNLKACKRGKLARAPAEMKDGFRFAKSPTLTVSPASAPEDPPTPFVESRLVNQFLADFYSDGIWDQPTPEDRARCVFFQEYTVTLSTHTNLTTTMELVPYFIPWPFKLFFMAIFYPLAKEIKKGLIEPFDLMEDSLSEEKPWFSGPKLGLADFLTIFPMDVCVQRGYFDATKYPNIAKWHNNVLQLQTYQTAIKKMGSYNFNTYE
ncbi:hypothetical protein ABW20_dc0110364 [Dactylellina cionopaga]|nr:hypothetical protein ABW20_dc0110364 [Dactylellina cionopaga]